MNPDVEGTKGRVTGNKGGQKYPLTQKSVIFLELSNFIEQIALQMWEAMVYLQYSFWTGCDLFFFFGIDFIAGLHII